MNTEEREEYLLQTMEDYPQDFLLYARTVAQEKALEALKKGFNNGLWWGVLLTGTPLLTVIIFLL